MDTKVTHTPGPWRVIPDSYDIVSDSKLARRFVAQALESTVESSDGAVYVGNDLEVQANARLIAACPAMYKFIRKVAQGGLDVNEANLILLSIEGTKS